MERLKVGVIGVGNMGERHCRIYSSLSQVNFVGVCDLAEERGRLIASKYETSYFKDLNEMLPLVDAVSIATTTPGHYPIGLECLRQGKHLLIEKPLALTVEQGQALVAAARDNGCRLMVGHIERYNPAFTELQSLLAYPATSAPLAVNIRRLSPFDTSQTDVDVVCDLMIHDLDLILTLAGRLPDGLETFGRPVFTSNIDHAVATLYYHDGPVITLTASRVTQQKVRAIELTTRDAYIEVDLLHKNLSIHRRFVPFYTNQEAPKYRQEGFVEQIYVPSSEPLLAELTDFVQSIRQGVSTQVTGQDGLTALALALEIRRKIELKLEEGLWRQIEIYQPSLQMTN